MKSEKTQGGNETKQRKMKFNYFNFKLSRKEEVVLTSVFDMAGGMVLGAQEPRKQDSTKKSSDKPASLG